MALKRSVLLVFVLLVFPFRFSSSFDGSSQGVRIRLTHVDSDGNFTKTELLQRSLKRDGRRVSGFVSRILASSTLSDVNRPSIRAPVHAGEGEFLMDLAIGTPSLRFPAIMDTGSDLTWTQCQPCVDCYKQPTPVFDPSSSSSFSKVSCSSDLCEALPSFDCEKEECGYTYSYGDNSITKGILATETFAFGTPKDRVSLSTIGFGCGEANSGVGFKQASGLVGLGRGPLSLVSQLKMGRFSYCLTKFGESKQSPLLLGSLATLNGSSTGNETTPLVKNPSRPSFYYLILLGISVGGKTLPIPDSTFALNADGTGGLIIDSGTSITYLESLAYEEVKKAFLSQVKLPVADGSDVGLDLCFRTVAGKEVKLPNLVFHFDGVDVDLPPENYLIKDDHTGLLCLAMTRSSGMSIFGNFQQQNFHVLYDLEKGTLSFVLAQCDQI